MMAESNLMTSGRHIQKTHTAMSRYVRNEYNDRDCRWLVSQIASTRCGAVKLIPERKMMEERTVSSTIITKLTFVMRGLTSSAGPDK